MRRLFVPVIAISLFLVFGLIMSSGLAATATGLPQGAATPGVSTNPTAIPSNINLSGLGSPRVLAWNPNTLQLAWYAASGQPVAIAKGSSNKALMLNCGTHPAGDRVIIYQGGDTAQPVLYSLDGGAGMTLGANVGLACAVSGRTQFSPDGNHLGLIKYDQNSVQANYSPGILRILKLPDGTEEHAINDVMSFDMQNDGTLAIQFFANTRKEANSADLVFWDGTKERYVEQDVKVSEDCQYVAGRTVRITDKVYTLLGEKCKQGGNKWRLRRTDLAGGTGIDMLSGSTGANGKALYFNNAASNDIMVLPSGNDILISVPNGLNSNIVDLARVSLGDNPAVTTVLTSVITDIYPSPGPRRLLRSPNGNRLAMVTMAGGGSEKLFLYDISQPDSQPIGVAGGSPTDRITGVAWSADGSKLFYTINGEDNGLLYSDPSGQTKRVARGIFQGLAVSADGNTAVTSEKVEAGTNDIRQNLVQVNVADSSKVNLVEGAKGEMPITPLVVR
jgi:hypothetical protein